MSIQATTTYAPAPPGCCPRTCQDIIDIIEESLGVSIPNITSVIISPNEPGVDERGNLWVKTDPDTGQIVDILVWNSGTSEWVSFFFHVDSLEPGDGCTSLMTWQGKAAWRTQDEAIDCIPNGAIPCSKISFGFVPEGCQNQTWNTTIKANQAAIDNGQIEFVVTWTSVTCGVGRRFVTQSPIVLNTDYTIGVCLPSDAIITSTILYGEEVNPFTNTTTSCTPPTCSAFNSILPQTTQGGPFVIPTNKGTVGNTYVTWAHGLPGRPVSVYVRFRRKNTDAPSGFNAGDEIPWCDVRGTDADTIFTFKADATNIIVYASEEFASASFPQFNATASDDDAFVSSEWDMYITATFIGAS